VGCSVVVGAIGGKYSSSEFSPGDAVNVLCCNCCSSAWHDPVVGVVVVGVVVVLPLGSPVVAAVLGREVSLSIVICFSLFEATSIFAAVAAC